MIAILTIFLSVYCFITWILPQLISWFIKRKYCLEMKLGRIHVPYFALHDVVIIKNGFSIHIDKIGFRSSFVSSEVSKLLCLVISDIRINKDVNEDDNTNSEPVVSRNKESFSMQRKIPPIVIMFAQFMTIHIKSVTGMFLHSASPEWLLHATATDVHLDGSLIRSAGELLVNITVTSTTAKLLRHANEAISQRSKSQTASCLAEISVSLCAEMALGAKGSLSVERLNIELLNGKAIVNDGFYSFAQQRHQFMKQKDNKQESKVIYKTAKDFSLLLYSLSPIIPKIGSIKLQCSSLTSMKDNIQSEVNITLEKLFIKTSYESADVSHLSDYSTFWPQIGGEINMDRLIIRSEKDKIFSLQEFLFKFSLEKRYLNVRMSTSNISLLYNHRDIHTWFMTNFGYLTSSTYEYDSVTDDGNKKLENVNDDWLSKISCDIAFELCNMTTLIRLSPDLLMGFNNIKFIFNYDPHFDNDSRLVNTSWKNWDCEFQINSIWGDLNYDHGFISNPQFKKSHYWGCPLYMGTAIFQAKETNVPTCRIFVDTVRSEWSPPLAEFINNLHSVLLDYRVTQNDSTNLKMKVGKPPCRPLPSINMRITNINLFLIAEAKVCIMTRVDGITYEMENKKTRVKIEGMKMSSIIPTQHHFICSKCYDVKGSFIHVKLANFEYFQENLNIELLEEISLCWSANLHMKFLTLHHDIAETYYKFKVHAAKKDQILENKPDVENNVKINVNGNCKLGVKLSSVRQLVLSTDDISFMKNTKDVRLQSKSFRIAVDMDNVFTVDGFLLSLLHDHEELKLERSNSDGFLLPWNKTWSISITSLKIIFPYEHSFSETVQNEFLSVVKWLKLIHGKSTTAKSKQLPSDFVIKVTEFLLETSDDPFEVSLRDNYELLVDEYGENIKRRTMLDEKVSVILKQTPLLPPGKLDELYASFQRTSSQIYIQRSKQMKSQSPIRTRLFAWLMSDVEIYSMADPSIHGPENVVRKMTEIDEDSPWPEEGLEFTTLWCRSVVASCNEWKFQLRDFPQPWLDIGEFHLWGFLVGAEQEATKRAKRSVIIEMGEPYGQVTVERSMTSLKYYHDFNCEIQRFSYAFGPCWEPVIAQCNLAFSKVLSASKDPSPPLPLWDKIRLIYHGRLTMCIRQLTMLLHASLDPYNTTEEMEVTWNDVAMDWTNAKFVFKGDLEVYVRTASKYDDCRLLYLPNLKLTVKLKWVCLGIPNDHHSVMPCAPDKLPEYSSNQEHDSFRAFRSQNLNLSLTLETKPIPNPTRSSEYPVALLYGSTLRWFENLKLILSGVTKPTRRGSIFNNLRPRRLPLSRHYRKVHLSLTLHRFQVHYWMSFSMQHGLELIGQRFTFASEHPLTLVPLEDGLRHRPRAVWSTMYMNCELNDAEIGLKSALKDAKETFGMHKPIEKCYFLSVKKVSYGRETLTGLTSSYNARNKDETPTHRLVIYRLKGAWTTSNRDIVFALYDSFRKSQQLKKNLSTAGLKGFRGGDSVTPVKTRSRSIENQVASTCTPAVQNSGYQQESPSPITKLQSGQAASMLQQLIAEAENKCVVYSDDLSVEMREQHLQGLTACQEDDVVHNNWLIALVNSQVLLKGYGTKGYVIVSAAKAEILQRIHKPVWKDRTLVSKTSWRGSLDSMQYYATVSARHSDPFNENIMWLSVENIQEKEASATIISELPDLPHLVGSGQSVGGVVSETVGEGGNITDSAPLQLQRIVSRCKCEFFYAGYGDSSIDPGILDEVPVPTTEESGTPWERLDKAVDAFTLMHHDLDVCTNSLQYAMILDIVNNLLLYVEPKRKQAYERLQRMRFQLQLQSVQDQRRPIQHLQNQIRCLMANLRRLEKDMYLVQRLPLEESSDDGLLSEIESLESQINECKEEIASKSDELDMMLSCYKETQISANQKLDTLKGDKPITPVRASEICFKHAQWRLTETDGQLGIADLVLSNFLYTKASKSDDSVEHLIELGYIRMTNLLANELYREVIVPTEIQSNMPFARKKAVRIFCREKAPVGGISVKEHFEINVVPFTIGLTKKFYDTMMKFCFPERDQENIYVENDETEVVKKGKEKQGKKRKESSFYVPIEMKDDIEKMKERAEKNKLFIYIKIPEVPVRVSYKGNKEKNISDIRDFSLIVPTLEYHNVTWTWLDLFLAMKNDSRRVLLSQAIKQKLQIKVRSGSNEDTSPQEEDKAKLLLGPKLMPIENKNTKKGIYKK